MGLIDRLFPRSPETVPITGTNAYAYVLARHAFRGGTLVFLDVGVFSERTPTTFEEGTLFSVLHEEWAREYGTAQLNAESWIRERLPGVKRYAGQKRG